MVCLAVVLTDCPASCCPVCQLCYSSSVFSLTRLPVSAETTQSCSAMMSSVAITLCHYVRLLYINPHGPTHSCIMYYWLYIIFLTFLTSNILHDQHRLPNKYDTDELQSHSTTSLSHQSHLLLILEASHHIGIEYRGVNCRLYEPYVQHHNTGQYLK